MLNLLLSRPALIAAAFGFTVLYYEGVPLVNELPLLDRIPLIGTIAVGKVERERREATREEAAQWEAKVKDLELQAAATRAEKVDEIAVIERQRLGEKVLSSLAQQKLQEHIDELEAAEQVADPACPPALPGSLSIDLNAIGKRNSANR